MHSQRVPPGGGSQLRRATFLITGSNRPGPKMKSAHTVEKEGMDAVCQRRCKGRSGLHMAGNATSVVMTTTLSRYAGANPPPVARSMRMPFPIHFALSPCIAGRGVPS